MERRDLDDVETLLRDIYDESVRTNQLLEYILEALRQKK